jgi:NADP-dependent 3-hydroxy acid dehydrogenase YdfG
MRDQWGLITGATAGIGKALAIQMAKDGHNLFICGRREERLNELKSKLEKEHNISVIILRFDIQNKKEIWSLFDENKDSLKKVTMVINNAGLARGVDPVDVADVDDWEQMIDTNIKGLLYITRYMLPLLKNHQRADIINIGSVSGRWTYPGGAVYCGTKHAVRAISEGLRQDLCGTNVKVCCIEPGLVETEFSEVRLNDTEKAKSVYADTKPLQPEDIAECIMWTLKRPDHVSIQELVVFPTYQGSITQVHREG